MWYEMLGWELDLVKETVDAIKKRGHGEVVIKIKNGVIYRVLKTEDTLIIK